MASITKAGITVSIENKVQVIRFNNPHKKNAIQIKAYTFIREALEDGANNPDVFLTVLTGTGDYYCSGFDMSDPDIQTDDTRTQKLKAMLDTFIDHPKLIVAVVNGPAIGLAVTMLGLCDIVYASERATFSTPFSKIGLCAEGCASYMFPRILGKSKANEMLLIAHKMSAQEALQFGLLSNVYKHSDLSQVWKHIAEFTQVSAKSIEISKKMSRTFDRQNMLDANQMEIQNIELCINSEEFADNFFKFLNRKSKL